MKKIVSYDDDDDDDTDEKWMFDAARLAEALRCTVAVEKHSHIHCHYDYLYEIAGSPIDCRSHNNKMLKPIVQLIMMLRQSFVLDHNTIDGPQARFLCLAVTR